MLIIEKEIRKGGKRMALFKPYKVLSSQLNSLPIIEGQLIITTDDGSLYLDINNSTRQKIADDETLEFEIVNALPTGSSIDESKIYLIESEDGGGGGGSGDITADVIINALGYTPYNAANPNGYITNSTNNLTNYTTTTDMQTAINSAINTALTWRS